MASIIIENALVVTPLKERTRIIENGALVIKESNIEAVGETSTIKRDYSADNVIDGRGFIALPGLIDAHIHSPESLMRGLAQDVEEKNWMHNTLGPIARHLSEKASVIGSKLTVLEGLRAGTTCFCDYGYNMDSIAGEVYAKIGARANICATINEFGSGKRSAGELYTFDKDAGEKKLKDAISLMKSWHNKEDGRITCHFGPQAADMMSDSLLKSVREIALENDTKIHMHIAQGGRERNQMMKRYGKSTVSYLSDLDFLDENLIAVHCHDTTPEEIDNLASNGVSMIGCPGSIGIIDGEVPPIHEFLSAGGVASLGSDQCPPAGHNMFNQMRYASILSKTKHRNPTVVPTWVALRLATINGARCHGLADRIGTLEPGKKADIILLDINRPNLIPMLQKPLRNIVPNLVYCTTGAEVTTVIIDGKIVMENSIIKTIDEMQVLKESQKAAEELSETGAAGFFAAGSKLAEMMKDEKI